MLKAMGFDVSLKGSDKHIVLFVNDTWIPMCQVGEGFFKVVELYPGRANAQKRAEVLNLAGVPCGRGTSMGCQEGYGQ